MSAISVPGQTALPCLVYSFGIANDFSFDDRMGKLGCEVQAFDPSMNTESYRRRDNVSFGNIGLDNANLEAFNLQPPS